MPDRLIGIHHKEQKASAAELLHERLLVEVSDPIGCVKPECRDYLVLVTTAIVPSFGEELLCRLVRLDKAICPLGLPINAVQPVPLLGELLCRHGFWWNRHAAEIQETAQCP